MYISYFSQYASKATTDYFSKELNEPINFFEIFQKVVSSVEVDILTQHLSNISGYAYAENTLHV